MNDPLILSLLLLLQVRKKRNLTVFDSGEHSEANRQKKKKNMLPRFQERARWASGERRGEGVGEISFRGGSTMMMMTPRFFSFLSFFWHVCFPRLSRVSRRARAYFCCGDTCRVKKSYVRLHSQSRGSRQAAAAVFYSRASRRVVPRRASAHKHCSSSFFFFLLQYRCRVQQLWLFQLQGVNNRHRGSDRWKKKKMEDNGASMIWLHLWLFWRGGGGGGVSTGGAGMEQKDIPVKTQPALPSTRCSHPMRQTYCNSKLNKPLKKKSL